MKIYLDTGNIEQIKFGVDTLLIDGVTTNPSLIAKEKKDFKKVLKEISTLMEKTNNDFTLSAEVTNIESSKDMIKQAKELIKIDKHIIIKVPMTFEGLKAVKELAKLKIRTNVTLIFSANQALLAAKAGAWCVSPFIGRLDDNGQDGLNLVEEIKQVFTNYNFKTNILAASIRSPQTVLECAKIGADIVTIPFKVFEQMEKHPLTQNGIAQFESDWENYKLNLSLNK